MKIRPVGVEITVAFSKFEEELKNNKKKVYITKTRETGLRG
jgi:hypothetical protein